MEIEGLGLDIVGMHKNTKAGEVLLRDQGNGSAIGLNSIEGALKSIDCIYERRKFSTKQTEEDEETYHNSWDDNAQQD